ncbi:MAG: T9SS type A sorting domain-containing protein [Bacteroidia bacterium]
MKKYFLLFGFILSLSDIFAQQIQLNSVVEHFTNTRCSICKNRNPGFYTNLSNQKEITHLSIHPSSPYSACILSKQNTQTNDARTNYYGIYGGTPRLVMNGMVIPTSANYNDANLFNPFLNLLSSFEVKVNLKKIQADSFNYEIQIKKVAESNLNMASLYSGLAEDTVFVDGGNGESEHYHVWRYGVQESINLPNTIGETSLITKSVYSNPIWNSSRMYAVALLQNPLDKSLIQSGKSMNSGSTGLSMNEADLNSKINIFPNPTTDFIYTNETATYSYQLINLLGNVIQYGNFSSHQPISVTSLQAGLYILKIENSITRIQFFSSIQITN